MDTENNVTVEAGRTLETINVTGCPLEIEIEVEVTTDPGSRDVTVAVCT
jgi:hypothetical protein